MAALLCLLLAALPGCTTSPHGKSRPVPPEIWIDLTAGEEASDQEVLDDLATAGVIYLGEAHSVARHHALQLRILQELFARRVEIVLCLEQLEARDQPAADRYNRREIDFDTLVREIDWPRKWSNYADYRALCEFARQHRIPVFGLNAPAAIVRAVSRGGGVAQLPAPDRAQLPADLNLDDPAYEKVVTRELAVHMAADPAKLRPMFEAQIARDEAMAAGIVAARRAPGGNPRTAVVILGAGHMRYGLGTPSRVLRREPGLVDRLVMITESGQLQLTDADKAASREVNITHADLRAIGRPPADYLRVLPLSSTALPPGHPPIGR
jgi:uncharacterized iron-regulated protein